MKRISISDNYLYQTLKKIINYWWKLSSYNLIKGKVIKWMTKYFNSDKTTTEILKIKYTKHQWNHSSSKMIKSLFFVMSEWSYVTFVFGTISLAAILFSSKNLTLWVTEYFSKIDLMWNNSFFMYLINICVIKRDICV